MVLCRQVPFLLYLRDSLLQALHMGNHCHAHYDWVVSQFAQDVRGCPPYHLAPIDKATQLASPKQLHNGLNFCDRERVQGNTNG
jgi:hypothetical protein